MFTTKNYRWIFILSILPYIAGIANILTYPSFLNRKAQATGIHPGHIFIHLWRNVKKTVQAPGLRRLIIQGMGYEGIFRVSRDYLQPILQAQALALSGCFVLGNRESTAITVGIVYFILYMISASASRKSHVFVQRAGGEAKALELLIFLAVIVLMAASMGSMQKMYVLPITGFIVYYILQNIWRPILVSQYDSHTQSHEQATILSIESQAKSTGVFLFAPVAGYIADTFDIATALAAMSLVLVILGVYSRFLRKAP